MSSFTAVTISAVAQRAAAVLVDQFEAAPGRREELAREFRNLLLGPFRIGLALGRALLELVLERDLDALLRETFVGINVPVAVPVSIAFSAASRRAGTNRYWKFLLPQFTRKVWITFL